MSRASIIDLDLRVMIRSLALGFILFAALLLPTNASAAEISAQNAQMLPASNSAIVPSSCDALQVTSFMPYIYDGELNSFDVIVSDSSYVIIAGSLNGANIPLHFVTRFADATGGVRMHVDGQSTSIRSGVTIKLTMLSSKGVGEPVCTSSVTITLPGEEKEVSTIGTAAVNYNWQQEQESAVPAPQGKESAGANATGATTALTTRVQNILNTTCAISGAASRLWTVLLAIYLLVVAAAILALPPFKIDMRSYILVGVAIALPLLVLFAVWQLSPLCHPGKWAPLFAVLIAVFGFVAGFRRHPSLKSFMQIFSLPEA